MHTVIEVEWELVCIPAILGVAPVCIDGTQQITVASHSKIMCKRMSCKCRVVCFYVEFEVSCEAVTLEEANHRL